jgi:histidyl-tRNA synthetase
VGYPEDVTAKEGTRVLFANFGGEDEKYSLGLLKQVRDAGIAAEIYLDAVKMGKQFKYADAKKIPFVAIIGENERKSNTITLKNMASGEQSSVTLEDLISVLKK